jgi:hypothetical protein
LNLSWHLIAFIFSNLDFSIGYSRFNKTFSPLAPLAPICATGLAWFAAKAVLVAAAELIRMRGSVPTISVFGKKLSRNLSFKAAHLVVAASHAARLRMPGFVVRDGGPNQNR